MGTDYFSRGMSLFSIGILLFALPVVPGVMLWTFLHPATFWPQFAVVLLGIVLYFVTMAGLFILMIILGG